MIDLLQQEANTGFPRLVGTRLAGTLPLTQALLNTWLRTLPQVPPGLAIDVHAGNRIVVRYGVVRATAVLDEEVRVGPGPPRVGFELASALVAWTLRQTVRMPAVQIDGRRVTIDLGAVEGTERYRPYWPYLQRVRLRTTPGHLHLDFEVAVT